LTATKDKVAAARSEGGAAIRVREASLSDAPQLPELCRQLGYPSTEAEVRARLDAIEASAEHALFVAEASGGIIVGFVDVFVLRTVETDPRGEIAGLVVDENYRSRRVGEQLVDRAEAWAKSKGCTMMGVRSNVIRDRAHAFYERLGYGHVKTQKSFRKEI
jgi:ribosomal protein S18 acetylase RimI-like enzyme